MRCLFIWNLMKTVSADWWSEPSDRSGLGEESCIAYATLSPSR